MTFGRETMQATSEWLVMSCDVKFYLITYSAETIPFILLSFLSILLGPLRFTENLGKTVIKRFYDNENEE